jgi:hypothetical protein
MRTSRLRRLIQLRYAVRETLLIVAGVLIALGFNAWWAERQDRRREASYIRQLINDAEANERILAASVEEDSVSLKALVDLSNALRAGGRLEGSPMSMFDVALRYSDPRPVFGTIDHLIGGGGIELIRDDSLRAHILEYSSLMHADLAESSRHVSVLLTAMPIWNARQQAAGVNCAMFMETSDDNRQQCDTEFIRMWPALKADAEYRSAILVVRVATWNRVFYLARMLEATTRFRLLLGRTAHGRPG